ncbi:MAG: sigma-70 family RNA polymerase sigma factor [Thermoguttaceae bacterium]|jgi:RNA polymerase sigma-70 factor (ECF subfamily)|nr:sigma-70 family RNA polymerase sigma factor [Thermoguttaceae bacterium]
MVTSSEAARELAELRAGGKAAVAQLFDRYRSRLARMALLRMDTRLVGKVDVDDVLQDAFVEANRRIGAFLDQPTVPFFVWLRQLTGQILIDVHRRYLGAQMRDVNREVRLDRWGTAGSGSALLLAQLSDSLTSPSQCAVRNEAVEQLRVALQSLGAVDREILFLRHLEELGNNEVADILGIDKGAASKRYVRALGRLRDAMPVGEVA